MYELWLIGIAAGIGVALGLAAAGAFARSPRAPVFAAAVALVGGGVIGWLVFDWKAGVAGAVAGALSGFGAGTFARGAVRRGGTTGGTTGGSGGSPTHTLAFRRPPSDNARVCA